MWKNVLFTMWFLDFVTVFNQSYNCQTSHYLGRNRLPKPRLAVLPFLVLGSAVGAPAQEIFHSDYYGGRHATSTFCYHSELNSIIWFGIYPLFDHQLEKISQHVWCIKNWKIEPHFTILQPPLVNFLQIIWISFTRIRFRGLFWGVLIFIGSKATM